MWITVNPVSSHAVGDVFTIKGTTNILRDEKVFIQVFPGGMYIRDHYGQCAGCHEKEILAFSTYDFVNVTEGDHGINRWSLAVNTSAGCRLCLMSRSQTFTGIRRERVQKKCSNFLGNE
jgi:hypothetical protein